MRVTRTRSSDATFDLNLAPVLDIIVSIVPMLLLSVAFVQVKMIESPTPQMVSQEQNVTPPKPETSITLRVSKTNGFIFNVVDTKGKSTETRLAMKGQELDFEGLLGQAVALKSSFPEVSRINLDPEPNISFDEIVKIMDQVRLKPQDQKPANLSISESTKAQPVDNTYLFPEVIFASVGG